mmetsp:Transcript_19042/g.27894  ORF Transcript_19042/g.27894 Transcript_19042/m.27894 type:complete len:836 (+) Transcript_19042:134-2641(+)
MIFSWRNNITLMFILAVETSLLTTAGAAFQHSSLRTAIRVDYQPCGEISSKTRIGHGKKSHCNNRVMHSNVLWSSIKSNNLIGANNDLDENEDNNDTPKLEYENSIDEPPIIPTAMDLVMAAQEGIILPETAAIFDEIPLPSSISSDDCITIEDKSVGLPILATKNSTDVEVVPSIIKADDATTVQQLDKELFSKSDNEENALTLSTSTSTPMAYPDVKKIIKFAIPAVGVWLCGPILSLIDTSAVGIMSGTVHQAALSPAVAVTDYSVLLMAFMYTATTNLVAGAQEAEKDSPTKPSTAKTLTASIQLSLYVGAFVSSVLLIFGRVVLKWIIGNDKIDPIVFTTALRYVRIRALAMPAAAVIGSAQAACLGMQDIRSPLYVLAAAALVNLAGDILLVGSKNPWLGGAAGAAWATVFSQYAALMLFLKWLRSAPSAKPKISENASATDANDIAKPSKAYNTSTAGSMATSSKVMNLTNAIMEKISEDTSTNKGKRTGKTLIKAASILQKITLEAKIKGLKRDKKQENQPIKSQPPYFSTRGFLQGRLRKRDIFKLPPKDTAREFLPFFLPVTTTSVGRVSAYVAMTHVITSSLGTVAMAAQQVIVSIFYCLTPFSDAINLTAQSFVPSIFERIPTKERAVAIRNTSREFIKAGMLAGLFLVGAVSCIPIMCSLFTSDKIVTKTVNRCVKWLASTLIVHGMICGMEGLLLGQKDLSFLGKAYAFYFVAVPYMMLRVKKAALAGANVDLTSMWKVFTGYQVLRFSMFFARMVMLCNDRMKEAEDQVSTTTTGTKIRVLVDDIDGMNFGVDVGKSLTEVEGLPPMLLDSNDEIKVKEV